MKKLKTNYLHLSNLFLKLFSVKKDKEGKIIEGNPDKIKLVTDLEVFKKYIKKRSKLVFM